MTYTDLIVPLDGSEFAETAVPHAAMLAKAFNARVTLIYVVEPLGIFSPTGSIGPMMSIQPDADKDMEEIREYLDNIVKPLRDDGIDVVRFILEGDAAKEICEFAQENDTDIIIMSTHGRSGFQRLVFGSVADGVLRKATIPVLLIRVKSEED